MHLIKSAMLAQPPSIITTDGSCGAWFVIPLNAELSQTTSCVLQCRAFWLYYVAENEHSCVFFFFKRREKNRREIVINMREKFTYSELLL